MADRLVAITCNPSIQPPSVLTLNILKIAFLFFIQ